MTWFSDIAKAIWRGHRVAFFRGFLPGTFELSLGQLVALITIAVIFSTLAGYALSTDAYMISGSGLNAAIAGWTVFGLLMLALKRGQHFVSIREVLAAAAAFDIWMTAILSVTFALATPDWTALKPGKAQTIAIALWGVWIAAVAWQYLATFWAGRKLSQFGSRSFGLRALVAALLVLFLMPQGRILQSASPDPMRAVNVWPWIEAASYQVLASNPDTAGGDEDEEPKKRVDFESILDAQADRVDSALGAIAPSTPGSADVYFVGMASYAGQDVFMREIQATRELFDTRFRTLGRSIVLNNNKDTAETLPIASLTNLKRVLRGLRAKMDVEEDILVLYLTSHGSKERLSVDFSRAPLNDLTSEDLAAALQAAGIKNRVVVISACHSGSFIPALQNETTAVLTAAHADKVSFGCSNEREWTYFSDALVNHALRDTFSFEDAFAKAKALIAEWESKDELSPSDPQIFVGAGIAGKLTDLARTLESGSRNAEAD